jgi:two-component system chemotaxis sensor kinase CheA
MNVQEVDDILREISKDILKYEDGDLVFVSDLMDRLEKIRSEFPAVPELTRVFTSLGLLLRLLLEGVPYGAIDGALSRGIDVLSRVVGKAGREQTEINGLSAGDITEEFGADCALFSAAAERALSTGKPVDAGKSAAPGGDGELELRISSEPFKVFLSEAEEKISRAQDCILELEKDPGNKQHVNELFRVFHTIKGECGFLRIASLGELAHNLENLLDLMRDGRLKADSALVDMLLAGVDYAKSMLTALKNGDIVIFSQIDIGAFVHGVNEEVQRAKTNIGAILLEQGKLSEAEVQTILQKQKELSFTKKFGEIAVDENFITREDLEESLRSQAAPPTAGEREQAAQDSIVKVKASQINFLVDMVGELIITEAQLDERTPNLGQLRKITREIQYASMQLRTEKVKNLFINMKRIARDAAKKLGKRVSAGMKGEDMEIDRDLVEKLEEPLMHLVRNSVAHGIESVEERLGRGKPAEGRISIEGERRGNTIVIAVEDDGRGLDREKILAKAVAMGLVAAEAAGQLSDADAYNFIFQQGFSTADNVDLVSGRGVGMDIVKAVAAAARGRVELRTRPGEFSRIEMIFPLSTAIIDGMIVKSGGTHFVIPVANVIESLRLGKESIHTVKNAVEVIDLREEIIPVIRLNEFFGRNGNGAVRDGRMVSVIVENNEQKKAALLLDEIITKREVFIKALGAKFRNLRGISSGTILQGGAIGFVLDVDQLTRDVSARAPAGKVVPA